MPQHKIVLQTNSMSCFLTIFCMFSVFRSTLVWKGLLVWILKDRRVKADFRSITPLITEISIKINTSELDTHFMLLFHILVASSSLFGLSLIKIRFGEFIQKLTEKRGKDRSQHFNFHSTL